MVRNLLVALGSLIAYVALSSLVHFIIWPEPLPPATDRPRSGQEVLLPGGLRFVYRTTAVESDGKFFEADWSGEPGAGIGSHTHPSQEVTFHIMSGTLRVVMGGEEKRFGPGERVLIPAGVEHQWDNPSQSITRGVFRIRPAGMADFVFAQTDRAFDGDAGAMSVGLQTVILIGTHGRHTAWPIRAIRFLVSPTARLFGYKSYYEPLAN